MEKGITIGDVIKINGKCITIDKWQQVIRNGRPIDVILTGGDYSASSVLLGVSYQSGRYSIMNELMGSDYRRVKVGRFKGETLARYIKMYLEGDYKVRESEL